MVVCKYFQEGYCRYGQNCRFEHVYGSKYSYHANSPAQAAPQPQAPSGITDEQLVQTMQTDVKSVLNSGQWLHSGYGPIKEKPNFPGISDLSPEEARLFIYEAKSNNTVEQAVAYMNNLTKEARSKYEQLLQPTPSIIKVVRSLYRGEFPVQETSNKAQTLFAQANNANASVFNPQQPLKQPHNTAQSIFSQASQNAFGSQPVHNQSFFGGADTAKSIFAQANKSSFVMASQPATQPFRSPFEQPPPFAQSTNMPQTSNIFQQMPADYPGVYSNMNEVSTEDLEMFKADSFKLGFIPEVPPPHSLCV